MDSTIEEGKNKIKKTKIFYMLLFRVGSSESLFFSLAAADAAAAAVGRERIESEF